MSSLPPPPPAAADDAHDAAATTPLGRWMAAPNDARPGDLTLFWRGALAAAWAAAFFAYAAVWQASVQIGIATWWVGPRSQPAPAWLRLLPFFVVLTVLLLLVYNVRGVSRLAIGGAAGTALIALPDFSRSIGVGVVEVIISSSLLIVGIAAHAGRYRLRVEPSAPVERTHDQLAPPTQVTADDARRAGPD